MLTFKKFSDVGTANQYMSYLFYMTNHEQHVRNDHANATKATTYIQPYRYKKSSLKSETIEKKGTIRFLENILYFGPHKSSEKDDITLLSARRQTALFSPSRKLFFNPL